MLSSGGFIRRGMLVLLCGVILAAPVAAEAKDKHKHDDDGPAAPILSGPLPQVPGPKRTIAVDAIDVIGPYATPAGWNVGGSITAMLTTALGESGLFIVVERAALSSVLTEQELATSGVAAGTAAPKPGKVIPAQYVIVGSVTEFSAGDKGGGFSIGGSSGSSGGGLSLGSSKGNVALDLRIVDTSTGSVLKSFKVQRKLSSTNVGVSGGYKNINLGGNRFWKTPLGEATRQALNDAVGRIAEAMAAVPWRGQVVEYDGTNLYVNAGAQAGIRVGDRLTLQRASKVFTDPATGKVISQRTSDLGVLTITVVEPEMSYGDYQPMTEGKPVRGDFLLLQH